MRKILYLAFLIVTINSYSQIEVSHQLNVINTNKNEYVDLKLIFNNHDTSANVLFLNVWRILMCKEKSEILTGVPYEANMINFLFITPKNYEFNSYFQSQTEFKRVGNDFENCKVKKMLPGDKFSIHIIITDTSIIDFIKHDDFQISYIYSVCNFEKMDRILERSFMEFYQNDDLIILDNQMLSNYPTVFHFNHCYKKENIMIQINEIFQKKYYNMLLPPR